MASRLRLPDGRTLGYAEYGDREGFPIINNHGGLTCRLDVEPAHEVALRRGFRIISPDRPGIALSDRKPGRVVLDWPKDVEALADHLGLEKFALFGWSLGGVYALACSIHLQDRIAATAVVGCSVPLDEPGHFHQMNATDRVLIRLSRIRPLERLLFRGAGWLARRRPDLLLRLCGLSLHASDVRVIRNQPAAFGRGVAEAMRNPDGMVDEYLAFGRPWGFAPEDVHGTVHVWQGDCDRLAPPNWGQELAWRLPGGGLHMVENEGHFLAAHHYGEIFDELRSAAEQPEPQPEVEAPAPA